MKKSLSLLLAAVLMLSMFAGCSSQNADRAYTLRAAVTTHLSNWSPLGYSNAQEKQLAACLNTPLWEPVIADTKTGSYQWVFLGAKSLEDVTDQCREDLTKYGGESVYEIKLRKELCWENGTPINAGTYLYSMDRLVRQGTRLREGPAALAGAQEYSSQEDTFTETVGFYAVDDWTLRYVCREETTKQELMMALAEPFLVKPDLYESNFRRYGTTIENTVSCGPYRLKQIEGGHLILVQNERYWEYREEKGSLVSTTSFQVDGKTLPQYQTTTIHIFRMTEAEARQAYQEGKIDLWDAGEADAIRYLANENLYRKKESFVLRLFFNTNKSTLQELDRNRGNKNSIVLSNLSFRKAMSLAIDRAQWVTATEGYTPALGLVNDLSYYDDTSLYRDSVAGMQAICGLYGTSLPGSATQAQVKEAYNAITGCDLTEAKRLMAESCKELVAEGLYREGEAIKIRIAWKNGQLTDQDRAQAALLEKQLNEAMAGTGFGKLTLEAVGCDEDRYNAVGSYRHFAVGLGAWGGKLFDPYSVMRLYCDVGCHETACWDPEYERLMLPVEGKKISKTWSWWAQNLCDGGELASLSQEARLELLATLEQKLLEQYYTIPLASTADCFLLSEKLGCYTQDYNVFYGFGGLRLLQYAYDDAQWQAHLDNE